jgi:tRNA A37 threonylcarbamoyladenosine synthetase subunit TsaC/SUA5/YrdC
MTYHPAIDGPVRGRPNIEADLQHMFEVLTGGGIVIIPGNVGYALVGCTPDAQRRIIAAKGRGEHKRQGIVMDPIMEREVHILDQRKRDIVDCITADYDLPLGVIARYREDHPLMRSLDPFLRKIGTANGTVSVALNDGSVFHNALGVYSREHCMPFLGSSANLTGQGAKYRVEDIEPEIIAAADLVLDYGLRKYHEYGVTATLINFETMEVLRVGACYELISDVAKRHFNWELPPDPGRTTNPHGHFDEFALAGISD